MKNGDQFAFPYAAQDPELLGEGVSMGGMTKREMFAMAAMQGILANGKVLSDDAIAEYALECADELLKKLES